jgi:hypothetical protein
MATKRAKKSKPEDQGDFYNVHLKPGVDNILITLRAIVNGRLPITTASIRIDVLNRWAHDTHQEEGEAFGLIIKKTKGENNGYEGSKG